MFYVYPCWKGLSVFHFWLFFHLPLDTNVMAIQMRINILDTFAGGWHKKLGPIEQRVCFNTLLRHSCKPFLESCASWIFCWPSRQVYNNFLIFFQRAINRRDEIFISLLLFSIFTNFYIWSISKDDQSSRLTGVHSPAWSTVSSGWPKWPTHRCQTTFWQGNDDNVGKKYHQCLIQRWR